jgi:hypothetical protein
VIVAGARAAKPAPMTVQSVAGAPALALAPAPVVADQAAEKWQTLIEDLLASGQHHDALVEWERFRAAHPDYHVRAELALKISAVRAQER